MGSGGMHVFVGYMQPQQIYATMLMVAYARVASGIASGSDRKPVFPMVDLMSHGYNAILGDPFAAGRDPGFVSKRVFNYDCKPDCFSAGQLFDVGSTDSG